MLLELYSNQSDYLEFRSTKDFWQTDFRLSVTLLRAAYGENTKQVYFNQSYNYFKLSKSVHPLMACTWVWNYAGKGIEMMGLGA